MKDYKSDGCAVASTEKEVEIPHFLSKIEKQVVVCVESFDLLRERLDSVLACYPELSDNLVGKTCASTPLGNRLASTLDQLVTFNGSINKTLRQLEL